MLQVPIILELFEFSELEADIKDKVLETQRDFELSTFDPLDYDSTTPTSYEEFNDSLTDADLIDSIKMNEYMFFKDGEMASIVTYCGTHPRKGQTVLTVDGKEYIIKYEG